MCICKHRCSNIVPLHYFQQNRSQCLMTQNVENVRKMEGNVTTGILAPRRKTDRWMDVSVQQADLERPVNRIIVSSISAFIITQRFLTVSSCSCLEIGQRHVTELGSHYLSRARTSLSPDTGEVILGSHVTVHL